MENLKFHDLTRMENNWQQSGTDSLTTYDGKNSFTINGNFTLSTD